MVEGSKIEWTDHTFNPWIGCQKVAPECDHCYAEAQNTICRRPCSAAKASAAAFHRCGARQYADAVRFRGAFGPQFAPLCHR